MKYCFDIDGTICTNTFGKYQDAKPIECIINQINELYSLGHEIHFFTARGTTTGIDWKSVTESQLYSWGIKYHSLTFGKPEADVYIDDKAVSVGLWNSHLIEKESNEDTILLNLLEASSVKAQGLAYAKELSELSEKMIKVLSEGRTIFWFGNGGSASDAQHLAAELLGRYSKNRAGLASIALNTDTSVITAIANDFGYEEVFSRQVESLGKPGDMLIGISTSGTSSNVAKALNVGHGLGMITVLFTGLRSPKEILPPVDFLLQAPSKTVARIQETHITWGQILCGIVEEAIFPDAPSAH